MRIRHLFEAETVSPEHAKLYRDHILKIWKSLPDTTVDHGNGVSSRKHPNLPSWLAKQPDADLPGIATAYDELEAQHRALKGRQDALKAQAAAQGAVSHDGAREATLMALKPYFEEALQEYVAETYTEEEIAESGDDPEWVMENLDEFLSRERSIRVRDDGLIQFWVMEPELHEACEEQDLMLVLFHYTSSSKLPSIKRHGLEGNRRSVNHRVAEGVYMTTETGGPAVEGYKRNACRGNKGYPVCITAKFHLYELSDDMDDADIQSGAHQYVVPQVTPDRFVEIERA